MPLGASIVVDVPPVDVSSPTRAPSTGSAGVALLVGSATCFGLSVVFAKEAYAAGVSVSALLTWRFVLAAVALWVVLAVRRPPRPSRRALLVCAGLGLAGYAVQSGLYFSALTVLDASVAALLLYCYPALVTVIAIALRRESAERRKLAALACCAVGLLLLLGVGGGAHTVTSRGVAMAVGAAVTYALYITVADRLPPGTDLLWMTAVVCTGAAASLGSVTLARGATLAVPLGGWLWIALLAAVSTVAAIVLFFAGLRRVGGPAAAILSCVEPVVSAVAGVVVYAEHLGSGQLLGGACVLGAVVVLQSRPRRSRLPRLPRQSRPPEDPAVAQPQDEAIDAATCR
jgi:drug/metabolite transporter (DMT)-like permease